MPADLKPVTYFGPGYGNSGGAAAGPITFGTANKANVADRTLPNLTDAEANASTGDVRKLYWAIIEDLYQELNAVNSAAPSADRFTKMSFTRFASQDTSNGIYEFSYNFSFNLTSGAFEVANET
jgi:hypothetical protein